jgi:hypothetical protein
MRRDWPARTRIATMTRYLLSVHSGNGGAPEAMTDEEWRRGFEQIGKLEEEMKAANALVYSGRLHDPDRARVVRPSKGRVKTTDGPYAETKEHLGGFYIIDADRGPAVRRRAPALAACHTPTAGWGSHRTGRRAGNCVDYPAAGAPPACPDH